MSQAIRDGMVRAARRGRYPGKVAIPDDDIRRVMHMTVPLAAKAVGLSTKHYKRRLARLEHRSMSQERMLAGFALYREPSTMPAGKDHNTMQMQPGTRLHRIIRLYHGWRLWVATRDYIYGTYTELHDTGRVVTIVTRADEGDEIIHARPSDEEIRSMQC